MRSPVSWALLGLVIQRPSYGYELVQRFERTYGDALELSSASQIYTALDALERRGLIEEMTGDEDDGSRQPKPHYRATAEGVHDYREWLVGQVDEERRRSRLFARQLAMLACRRRARVIERYEQACLREPATRHRTDDAQPTRRCDDADRRPHRARRAPGGRGGASGRRRATRLDRVRAPRAHDAGRATDPETTMSLLELEHVGRRYRHGAHERVVLRDVSLQLDAGELVAVWGMRRSGRSTLLRIAAGIEPPDSGVVRFAGRDLAGSGGNMLGGGIGYCQRGLGEGEGREVLEELMVAALARGTPRVAGPRARVRGARARGRGAVRPAHAARARQRRGGARGARARARAGTALLVIDEPIKGVDLLERDAILALLRSLADEGLAVLISDRRVHRALRRRPRAVADRGRAARQLAAPELAPVLPLRRRGERG